jgi:hypothetical protein
MEINNLFKCDKTLIYSKIYTKVRPFALIILLLIIAIFVTGCVTFSDPEASQEYNSDSVGTLDAQQSIGQSIIARRPNLNGITIWLTTSSDQTNKPVNSSSNTISIKLFRSPLESSPVFSTTLITPITGSNLPFNINIPNQKNPSEQPFYLLLSKDSGSIQIDGRNEDVYPQGQAYFNGKPGNSDIAFRLSYDYDFAVLLQDITHGLTYIWLVFPLLAVLWLPGWLVLDLTGLRSHFDFGEQTAMSTGISLAVIPVVMLWTTVLKIKWTKGGVLFFAGFLIASLIARLIYKYINTRGFARNRTINQTGELQTSPSDGFKFRSSKSYLLIIIFVLSMTVRLIMVRDLATPAWVDSVHHALITRLILTNGSYPSTYLPYFNISPTSYHPGFHSVAAAFTWLTNLNLAQSLLILGQVLNALCIFTVYLFTSKLTQSSSAGLFASFITGFLTPMPAYYTSWGRYTELTGLLILPVVLSLILLLIDGIDHRKTKWIIAIGAITAGGLFMVHYRVILFLACLIVSSLFFSLIAKNHGRPIHRFRVLLLVIIMALLGIFSVFPWFVPTITTTVLPMVNSALTTSISFFHDFSWPYLTAALGKQTLVIAGLGLTWGMIKRQRFAFTLLVWIFFLFLLANFDALHFPGGGLINNTSVEIMLFIPISILGGFFIDQILIHWKDLIPKPLIIPSMGIILLFLSLVAYSGAKQLVTIINPITILSRNADLPAIQWINEHIPDNEPIVINPFAWGYGLYAGSDGGYWISPLSGRVTLPPPVLYGLEKETSETSDRSQKVISISADPTALWEFLHSNQYHFIYIGAKGGVLSPNKLATSGLFNLLYDADGVWIFSLKP